MSYELSLCEVTHYLKQIKSLFGCFLMEKVVKLSKKINFALN